MPNPSREAKFSGANADSRIFIFSVQLTACRISNITWLIHTLAICVAIHLCTMNAAVHIFTYYVP